MNQPLNKAGRLGVSLFDRQPAPIEGLARLHTAGPEAGPLGQYVDSEVEDYSPS